MTKQIREVLEKLDRIELFITDERFDYKPGTFEWLARLDAAMSVRACRRQVKKENTPIRVVKECPDCGKIGCENDVEL